MLTFFNCDFDTTKSLPFKTCVQHGEDCQFQININVGGVPAASLSDYTWTAVYQDVSCLSVYYTIDAEDVSWNSQTNAVDFYFRHKYDMGAIAYRIFVYGTKGEENTVPAVIDLGMLPNPIFSASHVEPVPPTIDFSQYNLVNAPWTELSDFYTLSAEVKQVMDNYLPLSGGTMSGNLNMSAGKEIVLLRDTRPGTIYGDGSITTRNPAEPAPRFRLTLPIKNDTLAVVGDIPSLDGYATEEYVDSNLTAVNQRIDDIEDNVNAIGEKVTKIDAAFPVDASDENLLATEGYVDQELDAKVSKSGDTMTGDLTLDGTGASERYIEVNDGIGYYVRMETDGNSSGTRLVINGNYETSFESDCFTVNGNLIFYPSSGGTLALTSDIPSVPVSSVNGKTGNVVLSAESVSALPATPYTQQGYVNTWQLPHNATIIPNGQLDIKASNVIVPSIRSADNSNALLVPNGQGSEDWVARRSDIVNSDWNAISGTAEILNKPNIIPVTIDSYQGVYKTTTDVQQLVVANSDQSKFAYLFAPQGASDTRPAYIGTNGTVQAAKLQTSSGISPNPLTIPAGATANDAVARTSDLPLFETWTFELNDSTTVTKKVCIYN